MNYSDLPYFARDFLFYLHTIKGHSEETIKGYYIDLKIFLKFIKFTEQSPNSKISKENFDDIIIKDITLDTMEKISTSCVYEFLYYISNERKNSATSRARKISSLKTFFNYLVIKSKLIKNNPTLELDAPSAKKSIVKYLTLEQSIELLSSVYENMSSRDYCIINLFLNCGMRLSELVGINVSDIQGTTLKLLGKGNKERLIYLNPSCLDSVEMYLKDRKQITNLKDKNALFISRNGTRITTRRVQQTVATALKNIGLDGQGYSPHKLRHTAATLMYQHNNVDIRVLQDILGHSNIATTEIYTHVANKQVEDALMNSPLSKNKTKTKKDKHQE